MKGLDRIRSIYAARRRSRSLKAAEDYIASNESLRYIVNYANKLSESTGVSLADYVTLYKAIRKRKPKVVLECGTGKSTLIIAQAILDNGGGHPSDGTKLVSMEHDRKWYEHSVSVAPEKFADFLEIRHSPVDTYEYSFVRGHVYQDVPDYKYEFVFVDGPPQALKGETVMCDMDLIRAVSVSDTPVSGFIDNRKHTVLAYSLIFGTDKISYYPDLALGVVDNVTRHDMILGDKRKMRSTVFESDAVRKRYGDPA